MQKKLCLTYFTGYQMQTFLTSIKQHTLVKNMFLNKYPDSIISNNISHALDEKNAMGFIATELR